ncbi:hypothetical protein [Pseudomonas fulva]|uniref:hypothetical protein n=1 Tax=Pseudomonas fulva TaxID=47880 RepID=UPI0018AA1A33|nr:hypothetical protein [Pseudomonas fulva]MBF8692381.1 hypothetical protein [Pseudomonas fulva]
MDTNKMRDISLEQFKSWKGYPIPDLNSDGQFDKEYLQREWQAWQASRAAVVVELTAEYELPPTMDMQALVSAIRQQDIATIEAQGLKVTP